MGGSQKGHHRVYPNHHYALLWATLSLFWQNSILSVMATVDLVFVGENLALDLLNTAPPDEGGRTDLLAGPADVLRWLSDAGLLDPAEVGRMEQSPPDARLLWEEAVGLRLAAGEALAAWLRGAPIPDRALFALNRCLEARLTGVALRRGGQELSWVQSQHLTETAGYLAPVAGELADLFLEGDPKRVRRCAGPGCAMWFRDTSKNGSRRWCSMARCGNRAKVAAHYRRRKAQGGSLD